METSKNKLSDMRLRAIQIAAGIIAAAALFLSISLPKFMEIDANSLLNYLFVVVFLVVMMGRRSIENKYRLRLNLFSMTLMVGIFGAIIIFAAIALYGDHEDVMTKLDNSIKILIIVGLTLIFLGLGILFPILRYNKRKANGTLTPIRIPEKPEPTESEEVLDDPNRTLSTEEKIAAMARELDQDSSGNSGDSDDEQK